LLSSFVVVLVLPLVVDLDPTARGLVTAANIAIWAVFAVDYVARLYLALDRRQYVRTHVLDLVIVLLPMLRPLRALRVLRVLRVASVAGLAHKRATQSLHARVSVYVFSAALVSSRLSRLSRFARWSGAHRTGLSSRSKTGCGGR
jgi:voltage-gated potassium channel